MAQPIITLDLEGVMVPEIWLAVAAKTGIKELELTTRDIKDYDELMTHRLKVLADNDIKLSTIQEVISTLEPLEGAKRFLDRLRAKYQVIILSDTFREFAHPLMVQLGMPTIFCHSLKIEDDRIVGYELRQQNQKQKAVLALRSLNYKIAAAGDSFNDTTMLLEADYATFFHAPQNVLDLFPQLEYCNEYDELYDKLSAAADRFDAE
jgi:phosphoserine/homoserine phosphotransferase